MTTDEHDHRRGRLYIVTAAILWSSSGFFAKAPFFADWPGPVLAFWRAVFASIILFPLVRRPTRSWGLVPMTLCFAAMNYTYLTALVKGEASNAIWLQNTAPAWVFLVSVLVFRERATRADWLLTLFVASGVGLILCFELRGAAPAAVAYGLASGLFYSGIIISLRLLRDHDPAWLIALNHLVTAIILLPFQASAARDGFWPHGVQWVFLAGFGMIQMGLPYVLFARGLKTARGHEAAAIGLLEPILLPIWVFVMWRSAPNYTAPRWWTIAGGLLIMVGLALRYVRRSNREPAIT